MEAIEIKGMGKGSQVKMCDTQSTQEPRGGGGGGLNQKFGLCFFSSTMR